MNDKCNCGREIRYSHFEGHSCNKYIICPTYEDLRREHCHYRTLASIYLKALEQIKDINSCDYEYRAWAKKAVEFGESLKQ